jgi:hypothetical protein
VTSRVRYSTAQISNACKPHYVSYVALVDSGTRFYTFEDSTQKCADLLQEIMDLSPSIHTSFGRSLPRQFALSTFLDRDCTSLLNVEIAQGARHRLKISSNC